MLFIVGDNILYYINVMLEANETLVRPSIEVNVTSNSQTMKGIGAILLTNDIKHHSTSDMAIWPASASSYKFVGTMYRRIFALRLASISR